MKKGCLICKEPVEDGRDQFCKKHYPDIMLCVGSKYYSTIGKFIKESENLGCCRRVSTIPKDFEFNKSRVFLAHSEGRRTGKRRGKMKVFGYYYISDIQCIVKDGTDLDEELKQRGIEKVYESTIVGESERGCGYRNCGIYLVSYIKEEDLKKIIKESDIVDKVDVKGSIVLFKKPKTYRGKHFRGVKLVNGQKIIDDEPQDKWILEDTIHYFE